MAFAATLLVCLFPFLIVVSALADEGVAVGGAFDSDTTAGMMPAANASPAC